MSEPNPFLLDMPLVTIVKLVKKVGTEEVETPDTDCKRLWTRFGASYDASAGVNDTDVVQPDPIRVYPPIHGTEEMKPHG